mgnify:CR=1 FL=1
MDIDLSGIDRAIAALERIRDMGFRPSFDRFYQQYLRKTLRERYLAAAARTPYAPSSIGKRKRASGVVRGSGEDPGFGIDSGRLLAEVTGEVQGGVRISDTVIELMTVQPYGQFVLDKFQTKGPFAPDGIFAIEDPEVDRLFELAQHQIIQEWEQR